MKNLIKFFLVFFIFTTEALAVVHPSVFTEDEKEWIRNNRVVPYTFLPNWPVDYLRSGQHVGLTRDYLNRIEQLTGLTFRFVPSSPGEISHRLESGEVKMMAAISPSLVSASQAEEVLFTRPYLYNSAIVVTRADDSMVYDAHELKNKKVGVRTGSGYARYMHDNYPDIELVTYGNPVAALTALRDGKIYAIVGSDTSLRPVIQRQFRGSIGFAGIISSMNGNFGFGVSRSDPVLGNILDKALKQLSAIETDNLYDNWIRDTDLGEPGLSSTLFYYASEIAITISVLVLLAIFLMRARRAERAARDSEMAKTRFLAVMSHEIRTPMNAILAAIELMLKSPGHPRQPELTSLAHSSALSLLELLNSVLDFTQLEASQLALKPEPVAIMPLIRSVIDTHRISAEKKNVALNLSLAASEEQWVEVDAHRLRQILNNLLSNAIKFTEEGSVSVTIGYRRGPDGQFMLYFSVRDTGIGIDASQQSRLFQEWTQADQSVSRSYQGSGLGLSICKRLVELMQGRIRLSSTKGSGTVVYFCLPARSVVAPQPRELMQTAQSLFSGHILVIEDHPINQIIIREQLTLLGCELEIASDGYQALALLEDDNYYDLVFLDCNLPGISGYEVAERIRTLEAERQREAMPVIAISALTSDEHREMCLSSGMDGSLSKPLTLEKISSTLRLWLDVNEEIQIPETDPQAFYHHHEHYLQLTRRDIQAAITALNAASLQDAIYHIHRIHGAALVVDAKQMAALTGEIEDKLRQEVLSLAGQHHVWVRQLDEELEKNLKNDSG